MLVKNFNNENLSDPKIIMARAAYCAGHNGSLQKCFFIVFDGPIDLFAWRKF